jgi:hypothetical protein
MVLKKVGLKAIQKDEISYEFTIVFDIHKTLRSQPQRQDQFV